jgi:hypothetical protein
VTSTLLGIDTGVVIMALALWTWAGLRAAGVSTAVTPRELAHRAGHVLILIGLAIILVTAHAGLVAILASAVTGQGAIWLLLAASIAAVAASVPRLIAVRRTAAAFTRVTAMPPVLRHGAAHPLIAWPAQVCAYAAGAGLVALALRTYPPGFSLAVAAVLTVAVVVTWRRRATSYARLGSAVIRPARR